MQGTAVREIVLLFDWLLDPSSNGKVNGDA